jgi:phosphate ABC transporter phosphate-binding protein
MKVASVNRRRKRVAAMLSIGMAALFISAMALPAQADSYVPVSGAGSTWSENALSQWIRDVQQYGMRINYAGTGSSDGRRQFLNGTVDFAASDIPFQSHPDDGSAPENPTPGTYAYMPITAGGTVFMYNLTINGQRVTNLRLSGENVVKIFTRVITTWNDPAIAADNPGLKLPDQQIVPVVRSDGSAATYHLTEWMIDEYGPLWNAYCSKSGRAPACGPTSLYPTVPGIIAQAGDLGIAGYVSQNYAAGSIGFVNYSYALNTHFPVAKLLNAAGYYTEPTAQNVAVSLLKAQINTTSTDPSLYLTQNLAGVFSDTDPRTYVLSSYGYLILPTKIQGQFTAAKGKTLAAFASYAMCQGQQESASLGYSPMPVNLVEAGFSQIAKIPGSVASNVNIATCHNPTFSPDGTNLLAQTAPMPPACDKQGATQCSTGTGGARQPTTVVVTGSGNGGSKGGSGGSTGGGQTSTGGGVSSAGSGGSTAGGSSTGTGSASTGTGTGASTGGGTGSAASTGGAATSNTAACDPSSGACGTASSAGSGSSSGSGSDVAAAGGTLSATPVVLTAANGWGSTQVLMLIALILLIAVIVVPAFLVRRFRNEDAR